MSKQAIELKFNGKRVRMVARVRFSGDWAAEKEITIAENNESRTEKKTIKELVLEELQRQFSSENPYFREMIGNDYDFPEQKGQRIKVSSTWIETNRAPYVCFHVIDSLGVSAVPMFPVWRKTGSKHIVLFTGDLRSASPQDLVRYVLTDGKYLPKRGIYSAETIAKIACHEFGHTMGIGDLYGGWAPYGFCYRYAASITPEMPRHDIMRTHFCDEDFFTPNDLEMALLAQEENAPQSHIPTGPWKGLRRISRAVRLKNIDSDSSEKKKAERFSKRKRKKDFKKSNI